MKYLHLQLVSGVKNKNREEIASYLPSGVLQLSERDGVEEDHNEAMEVDEIEDLDIY